MRDYLEELLRALAAEEETEETPARWQTEVEFPPAEGRAPEQESEALADILEAAGSAAAVSLWGNFLRPPLCFRLSLTRVDSLWRRAGTAGTGSRRSGFQGMERGCPPGSRCSP